MTSRWESDETVYTTLASVNYILEYDTDFLILEFQDETIRQDCR